MTNVEQAASGSGTLTRLARIAYRIFGRERLDRWLAEPPRCEWVTPSSRLRCFRKAGHSGACLTETTRTNTQTGKTFTVRREWYGINYSEEGW